MEQKKQAIPFYKAAKMKIHECEYFYALLFSLVSATDAFSDEPSIDAEISCFLGKPTATKIQYLRLPSHDVVIEDNYKDGNAGSYILRSMGKDVGYAEKGNSQAIIYDKNLYPLKAAIPVRDATDEPSDLRHTWQFGRQCKTGENVPMCKF